MDAFALSTRNSGPFVGKYFTAAAVLNKTTRGIVLWAFATPRIGASGPHSPRS